MLALQRQTDRRLLTHYSKITMASTSLSSQIVGYCLVKIHIKQSIFSNIKLQVMQDPCCDIILGHEILSHYTSVNLSFGGPKLVLDICGLQYLFHFNNLNADCKQSNL